MTTLCHHFQMNKLKITARHIYSNKHARKQVISIGDMNAQGKKFRANGTRLCVQFRTFVLNPRHFLMALLKFLIKSSGIAILTVTSPIVINVPNRSLLVAVTKDSFDLWLAKSKYQKTCL